MTAYRSSITETAANLARIVVPPVGVAAACGLGIAGAVADEALLGAAGALAGALGAGAAWWQSRTVEGRFRTERMRNREGHRRLQLVIEDLRRRRPVAEAPDELVVPDHVPDEMPTARPLDAPDISMELPAMTRPVLSSMDEAAVRSTTV